MAKYTKELMAELHAAKVKRVVFDGDEVSELEFFAAAPFGSLDLDTIIPPAHDRVDQEDEREPAKEGSTIPSALRRLLEKGSVS